MFAAAVSFSLMGLFVRLLKDMPSMEIVLFRAAITLVISAALLLRSATPLLGREKPLLLLRGVFGFLGLSAYFYSIHELPLAEAVTVQYTNPLFTALFAPLILGERNSGNEWKAGLLCFAGVLCIARPGVPGTMLPVLIGLAGAMCSGVAYNLVRKLGIRGEDPLTIVLYFPLVALVLGTPFAMDSLRVPVGIEWILLLGVGLTTQAAQVSMTKGMRTVRVARASMTNYLVIVLSALYSLALGEQLTLLSWLGMACIFIGIAMIAKLRERIWHRPE